MLQSVAGMFGTLDYIVIAGVAGLAVYYFFLKKDKEEPSIKDFKVA